MTDWQRVKTGLTHGGYVAWETALAEAEGDTSRQFVPVFIRLRQGQDGAFTLAEAIDATLAHPSARFSRHERDLLVTERAIAGSQGWAHEVRTIAFCPRDVLQATPDHWEILQVGPGLALGEATGAVDGQDLCAIRGALDPLVPLVAVIDDGIGFLNARFRATRLTTRFKAVWMQAPEGAGPSPETGGEVVCGRVIEGAEIDRHLNEGGEEAQVYRQVNRALLLRTDQSLTDRRVAHGTHVLDLAAGATIWTDDPMRAVPILAVQLPPEAIRETAGRRMEAYLVQGLRWILAQTLRLSDGTNVPPVVINLSIGSLAGPGDETAFLADWFRFEIARHARLTGGEVRLVVAYGNARLGRLVARGELRRSTPLALTWRVLPDDRTSSFLELRVDAAMASGLVLHLTPPAGSGLPDLCVPWPEPGTGWRLPGPLAAVTASSERGGQSLLHLALGPTMAEGRLDACPPGMWQVEMRTTEAEPVRLTARVQRDDTPAGHRPHGRQSWLDHPRAWDWDGEARAYVAPRPLTDAPGCPITREGTCVAYAGAEHNHILFVGSVRPVTGKPDAVHAMPYSSQGVQALARPGESRGPTLVAQGDDGAILQGRAGAGVLSGTVARLSGTSMAAPLATRALIRYFLTTRPKHRSPQAEQEALTGYPWQAVDPRLGHGALVSA